MASGSKLSSSSFNYGSNGTFGRALGSGRQPRDRNTEEADFDVYMILQMNSLSTLTAYTQSLSLESNSQDTVGGL